MTSDDAWTRLVAEEGRALLQVPRGEVVRQHLSHLVHHRGQLTVYLRLVNVPLSSVYGPTAAIRTGQRLVLQFDLYRYHRA